MPRKVARCVPVVDALEDRVVPALGLLGEYFANRDLLGEPVVTRIDSDVNFNWGSGSPAAGVPADHFSARWTGFLNPQSTGLFTLQLRADNGVRAWVNDALILDRWGNNSPGTHTATPVALTSGEPASVRVEFQEYTGNARAELRWRTPLTRSFFTIPTQALFTPHGLTGDYFNNPHLAGSPTGSRADASVFFDWGTGSPGVPGIGVDDFSVRWTGRLQAPQSGDYVFRTTVDNGVRLAIGGLLLTDAFGELPPTVRDTAVVPLTAGTLTNFRMEFTEYGVGAMAKLEWQRPGAAGFEPVPARAFFSPDPNAPPPPPPAPNTPPTISNIADRTVHAPHGSGPISFTIGDAETPTEQLIVSATSTNLVLVPGGNVVFSGSGANRTLTITPTPGQTGSTTITITVTDAGGLTASDPFVFTVQPDHHHGHGENVEVTDQYISAPHDKFIPNFGAFPTAVAAQSGAWENPTTWTGGTVPGTNAVVAVPEGVTVTITSPLAATFDTVGVRAGGKLRFAPDTNTSLKTVNLIVYPAGELEIGSAAVPVAADKTAQILIADRPLDLTTDPSQYGHGVLAFGRVTIHGAPRPSTFVRLAAEPLKTATQLVLSAPAVGWRVGDTVLIPDSHQLEYFERGANYTSQAETATITAISADHKTLTIGNVRFSQPGGATGVAAALQFNHWGARAPGTPGTAPAEILPHVVLLNRNVTIRSENPAGVRGHTFFSHRAEVDIAYADFADLGRTTMANLNNTVRTATGGVTSVGTNQQGRYAVHLHHLYGAEPHHAGGTHPHQFHFVGNSVSSLNNGTDNPHRWAVALHGTSYGTVANNTIYNIGGVGVSLEDGSEIGNLFQNNFVGRVTGNGNRDNPARQGIGFWIRNPDNQFTGNVTNNIRTTGGANAYGFNIAARASADDASDTAASLYSRGIMTVAKYAGANPHAHGQGKTVNVNAASIARFENNEVYGGTAFGLSVWDLGVDNASGDALNPPAPLGVAGVLKNTVVWHIAADGFFGYPTNGLTIDGFTFRSDLLHGVDPINNMPAAGIGFSDYNQRGLIIRNADIRGAQVGVAAPVFSYGEVRLETSVLQNRINVLVQNPWSVSGPQGLPDKSLVVDGVDFRPILVRPTTHISMNFQATGRHNLVSRDSVFVTNSVFAGVPFAPFRQYYLTQAAGYKLPPTGPAFQLFDTDGFLIFDGVDLTGTATTRLDNSGNPLVWAGHGLIGTPTAWQADTSLWLTNAQAFTQFGVAAAGEIAPAAATTRSGFKGLLNFV